MNIPITIQLRKLAETVEVEKYRPHDVPEKIKSLFPQIYKNYIGEQEGYRFYLVDGLYIRNKIDKDFIQGGNFARDLYVPEKQLWIEYFMKYPDQVYTMLHEFLETRKMVNEGWNYDTGGEKAHSYADNIEGIMRKDTGIKFTGHLMPDFITLYKSAIEKKLVK